MKNLVVLTGAGISAESGIKTFRDADGLWEGHDIMEVASPDGWHQNAELVLDFYNKRRAQLKEVQPNSAHKFLAYLEQYYKVNIITQNVDNLHERAGSNNVLHLHGELIKVRSTEDENLIYNWENELVLGDVASDKAQLRPHIVWFGEDVPLLETAASITETADILVIVGTSMQVYPAASLINFVKEGTPIYFIDPKPSISKNSHPNLTIIPEKAVEGVRELVKILTN